MLTKSNRLNFFQPVKYFSTFSSAHSSIYRLVQHKLDTYQIPYRVINHPPEGNCEKVSLLRGTELSAAAKSLLILNKASNVQFIYSLAVLPGDRRIDFMLVSKHLKVRSASMAPSGAVKNMLNCDIGSVPPISFNPLVKLIVDESLLSNEKIYFSPGKLDQSFEISSSDYRKLITAEGGEIHPISFPQNVFLNNQSRG